MNKFFQPFTYTLNKKSLLTVMRGSFMLYIFLVFVFMGVMTKACFASGITNYPCLNTAEFWQGIKKDGDELILNDEEVARFNQEIIDRSNSVYDLSKYPTLISGTQLKKMLGTEVLDDSVFIGSYLMSKTEKERLLSERNLTEIFEDNKVQYGVVVRRSNLRTLPTMEGIFESAEDKEFDYLQETAVDPSEPVVILHESKSKEFYFVQMRNYYGWVLKKDIALANREMWLTYVQPNRFLTVLTDKIVLQSVNEAIIYQMGSKIKLAESAESFYEVILPTRNADGKLIEISQNIAKTIGLIEGNLPYTKNNIIQQSFKFLQEPYGWGGLKNSVDCSSFIADIYRSFGIELPRNADEQELTAGKYIPMASMSSEERLDTLKQLNAGDVIFFDGHVMLYLGMTNGTPYIIHSLGSHTLHQNGTKEKVRVMKVVVSDLSLKRYSGISFLDALTGVISYQF